MVLKYGLTQRLMRFAQQIIFLNALLLFNHKSICQNLIQTLNRRSYEVIDTKGLKVTAWANPKQVTVDTMRSIWKLRKHFLPIDLDNYSRIRSEILKLSNGEDISKNFEKDLFDFRTTLKFIRSLVIVCSKKHQAPQTFHLIVKKLGALRDDLKYNNGKKSQKISKKLLRLLELSSFLQSLDELQNIELEDDPINWLTLHIQAMRSIVSQESITAHGLHEVRKRLEHLLAFLESLNAIEHHDYNHNLYLIVYKLHRNLGKIHNQLISDSCEKKLSYEGTVFHWPVEIRSQLKTFLSIFD